MLSVSGIVSTGLCEPRRSKNAMAIKRGHLLLTLLTIGAGCASPGKDRARGLGNQGGATDWPGDLQTWLALIEPTAEELSFERIGWAPSFHEGMKRASRERKPLLLWVMNGHPLGCT